MEIPILYQVIVKRFKNDSWEGKIEVNKARQILTYIYRVPKNKICLLFKELRELGMIAFENKRWIHITFD